MELRLEHLIPRPLADVEARLLAPDFAARLARDGELLDRGEELAREDRGAVVVRTAHFVVRGALPLLGRFGAVGWTEVVTWTRSSHSGTFVVTPDLPTRLAVRVRCRGRYLLAEEGPATRRTVDATVELAVPLAREIERRVGEMLQRLFDDEAVVLGAAR